MISSFVSVNSDKMGGSILAVILNLFILSTGVSSTCVNVPNNDMVEYSCVGGTPFDLYGIPEGAEKIRIANISLPRITRDTFSKFGDNLWVLTCTHCGIREIDDDAFASLTNLQQLRLDNNHVREVKASWFRGMNYLTYLDFNYNEIETIEDGVYANLPGLVDFRVSGNKLQCLNVNEMSRLVDLKRIFLSKNPEFQCPNSVSSFLEERDVTFDRDPEWSRIPQDTVSAWRFTETATPGYHEKLISQTTQEPPRYEPEYRTYTPETPSRPTPAPVYPSPWWVASSTTPYPTEVYSRPTPAPVYPSPWWVPSTTTPYPQREWPSSVPTSDTTDRVWPASMPNSHPTHVSHPTATPSTVPYPVRHWETPTPSNYPPQRPDWHEQPEEYNTQSPNGGHVYGQTDYYPPVMMRTSTADPVDEPRTPYENYPPRVEEAPTPPVHLTPPPPLIEWAGNSAEVFTATDYPLRQSEPQWQTDTPATSGYPTAVHEIPITSQRPATMEESNAPTRHPEDVSKPKVLDTYQAVQEPNVVTIAPPESKPSAAGSITHLGVSAVIVAICVVLRPFATIQ